jgi:PBP1b-binding outer membrane lipoprotein LpoB
MKILTIIMLFTLLSTVVISGCSQGDAGLAEDDYKSQQEKAENLAKDGMPVYDDSQ